MFLSLNVRSIESRDQEFAIGFGHRSPEHLATVHAEPALPVLGAYRQLRVVDAVRIEDSPEEVEVSLRALLGADQGCEFESQPVTRAVGDDAAVNALLTACGLGALGG